MLDDLNEKRLSQVNPQLATRVRSMILALHNEGISILITQGLRTWAEQDALYQIGRRGKSNEKIVTKAKGGQSYHNYGLAVDIVVLDSVGKADWDATHPGWARAVEVGKAQGLAWGGDFPKFKDMPHFEYTNGLVLDVCRSLYEIGGLEAVWAKVF